MAASARILATGWGRLVCAGGILAGLTVLISVTLPWFTTRDDLNELRLGDGIRVLNDAEMARVRGGWLEPKARKPRGGCPACGNGGAGCSQGTSCGQSPDGSSPSMDATTADVGDRVGVTTLGSNTLTLSFAYSSHLADGTNTILATTMGSGWTHSYNSFLLRRGLAFLWIRGDTEIVRFTNYGGHWRTSTGQFMELTETGPDTAEVRMKDGTVYQFRERTADWLLNGVVYPVETIVDGNLRETQFAYDAGGRVESVTDAFGHQMGFEYNPQGKLSRVTAAGREVTLAYDAATGQPSVIALPNSQTAAYEYNFRGQITSKTTPIGGTYTVEYNPQGKAVRLRDPQGQTIAEQTSTSNWEPDHAQSLLTGEMHYMPGTASVTDGRGNVWQHEYDARGQIVRTTDPQSGISTIEYDPATLLSSRVVDANGHVTEYEYDARGNRTLTRDAEGNETTYEHEPVHNRLTRRVEPDDDEWLYEYDAHGNLVKEIDPLHGSGGPTIDYEYDALGLLIRRTDRNGNATQYEYDAQGNLTRTIDPVGAEMTYTYDAFGNMLSRAVHNDTGDQSTAYTYDSRDRVITETDPLDHVTRYEYDADGNRTAVFRDWVDPATYRDVTRYEYDHRGRMIRMIEDEGGLNRTTQYEYDANDNRTREINPNGAATEYEYDSLNRMTRSVEDPGGLAITWQYEYDPVSNRIARTDPRGQVTTYQYDPLDRQRFVTDPLGFVTEYRYAPPGGGCCGTPGTSLIKCVIDAAGKVTKYEYDALDRRVKDIRQVGVQDCDRDPLPEDAVTQFAYDANGNTLAVTDANGNTTTSTYTARNEVETVTNGAGETAGFAYDAAGNRVEEHMPNGNIIAYEYDLRNQLAHVSDTLGDVATYTYDAVGSRTSAADALGHTTTYEYDHLDRLVQTTDPLGASAQYEYDAVGNQTRVVDRMGNQTVYEYDAANRQTVMRYWPDAGGSPAVITRAYDPASNLVRITDANGNPTEYEYDTRNQDVTETYTDGTAWRYTYDGVGNRLTREDGMGEIADAGNLTTYVYDDLHRLISRQYATGEADEFEYDTGGRMLRADNLHSHIGYTYDAADRVLTSTQTDLPQTYSYTVAFAYDVVANTRTLTYPSGKVVVEQRDLRDRLDIVTLDGDVVADYAYDLADRVVSKTFENGSEARFEYNENDWLTSLRHVLPDGTTTFAGFAHTYDAEGNRLSAENLQQTIPYADAKPVTHSEQYAYDDVYRLVDYRRGQWVGGVPAPRRQRDWQLDPVHNWERFGVHDLDTGEDAAYCNSINQMNEYDDPSTDEVCPVPDDDGHPDDFMVSPCPPAPGGPKGDLIGTAPAIGAATVRERSGGGSPGPSTGFNRAHDKNGNLVDDGQKLYFYDYQSDPNSCLRSENRLTEVRDKTTGDVLGQYSYDAVGRRVRKLIPAAPDLTTVYMLTPEWREIEEYEAQGAGPLALARSYTFGSWIDEPLTLDRAAEADRYYYHDNALSSTLALTDETGAPAERYAYDAYGTVSFADAAGAPQPTSTRGNPALYHGRRYEVTASLYFFRARYMDPATGRFTTRDPLGTWGDLPGFGSGLGFAASDPIGVADPHGLLVVRWKPIHDPGVKWLRQGGGRFSQTSDILDPTDNKTKCGTVNVSVGFTQDDFEIDFKWTPTQPVPEGKCCLCGGKSNELGWIQHVLDAKGWRYDNGAAGGTSRDGAASNPDQSPQPVTKRAADLNEAGRWIKNPWYSGSGNVHEEEVKRLNKRLDESGASKQERTKALEALGLEWDWTPKPQTRIWDSPSLARELGFRTQLVCVETGKVIYDYGWALDQFKTGAKKTYFIGGAGVKIDR